MMSVICVFIIINIVYLNYLIYLKVIDICFKDWSGEIHLETVLFDHKWL